MIKMIELSGELLFSLFNQVMSKIGRNQALSTSRQRLNSHLRTGCSGQQLVLSKCILLFNILNDGLLRKALDAIPSPQ